MRDLLHAARAAVSLPLTRFAPPTGAFLLSAAVMGGQYGPWALAAVAAAGVGWRGLSAVAGTVLGALAFWEFQPGLRHCAAAVLILCANTAFCTTRLYRQPWFRPTAAAGAAALVQLAYLWQRGSRQWALCAASLALLYGVTSLWSGEEHRQEGLFCLLLGGCGAIGAAALYGFSPALVCGSTLALAFAGQRTAAERVSVGALVGLTLDLCGDGEVRYTVVLAVATGISALPVLRSRAAACAAFCTGGLCSAWLTGEAEPLALLCALVTGCGGWLLLPEKAALEPPQVRPASAAAFQAVYDSLPPEPPLLKPENPAVLFDRAAEQVCRDCPLRTDCWQSHYTDTYNAFNDACPRLLYRGRPLAEDFPPYFAARCVRFSRLLTALEGQVRDYLMRRASHARLGAAYRLAREQYAQMSQVLSPREAEDSDCRYVCRIACDTRPRKGETVCGDEVACFAVGERTYLLLSDGMGSGEGAHHEAAMTVRLLRQFLTAGIEPLPALKTLNTALTLRCQTGGGFTTIDLACIDGVSGIATLYKYGAAASYLKKGTAVAVLTADTLPAGLENAQHDPPPRQVTLAAGSWLVMVSDGITAGGDGWLRDLLTGWDGTAPRELVGHILREARQRGGEDDDCAVIAAKLERCGGKKAV